MPISKITGQSIEDGSIVLADLGITTFNTGAGNTLTLQANSATGITIDVTGNTAIANTLSFTGTGARIRGDFSNATIANQTLFQSSTTNGNTTVYHIPNGTGTVTSLAATNSSDVSATSLGAVAFIQANATDGRLGVGRVSSSGSFLPLTVFVGGGEKLRIDTSGNVGIGVVPSGTSKLDVNGQIYSSNGTASAPGFTSRGQNNAGLFFGDDGVASWLGLSAGGVERMRVIGSTGNVGINTTAPSQRLHVAAGNILTSNTAGTIATVSIAGNGSTVGTSDFALQQGTSSEAYVYNRANSYLVLGTNNTERMRIDSSGNVGIGTSSWSASGARLAVWHSSSFDQVMTLRNTNANGLSSIRLEDNSGSYQGDIGYVNAAGSTGIRIGGNSGTSAYFLVSGVGIGTSSPARRLDVRGSNTTIRVGGDTNDIGTVEFFETTGSTINASISSNRETAAAGGDLRFATKLFSGSLTERMRITAAGRVGIGITSPNFTLSTNASVNDFVLGLYDNTTYPYGFGIRPAQLMMYAASDGDITFGQMGTVASSTFTERMRITSGGNVGIGTSSPDNNAGYTALSITGSTGGQIYWRSTGSSVSAYAGADSTGGYIATLSDHALIFRTNNTERGRFTNQGAFMVGTNIAVNSTDLVHKIGDVASGTAYARLMMQERGGNWISFNDGAGTHYGTIVRSGSGVSYGSNSDYRLKENIVPMTGALNKVAQLKPCTYTWKSTGEAGQGFIAHELQEVIPDAVSGEKDGINPETDTPAYQTVDTSFLVATLTAAIQEQQAIIESLKSRIEILEQK